MKLLLSRRNVDLKSGTGQLIYAQHMALVDAGINAELVCAKGVIKYYQKSGILPTHPKRSLFGQVKIKQSVFDEWVHRYLHKTSDGILIEHGLTLPRSDITFIHNFRPLCDDKIANFSNPEIWSQRTLIANSKLVKKHMGKIPGISEDKIFVEYPGYDSSRFSVEKRLYLREMARAKLQLKEHTTFGLITSGHFEKRGLDVFVEIAEEIHTSYPNVRFFVLGSKCLPGWAKEHPLVKQGIIIHRPKCAEPELWMSVVDAILYPAAYEEFGMVILEAAAMGLPIISSSQVGASELVTEDNKDLISEWPEKETFVQAAKLFLESPEKFQQGALSHANCLEEYALKNYGRRTKERILSILNSRL